MSLGFHQMEYLEQDTWRKILEIHEAIENGQRTSAETQRKIGWVEGVFSGTDMESRLDDKDIRLLLEQIFEDEQ